MRAVSEIISEALTYGFSHAAQLNTDALIFRPEVREMCAADRCRSYGRSHCCPPACGTLEEAAKRAGRYTTGVLLQTVGTLEDSFDIEAMTETGERHKRCFADFVAQLRSEFPQLLPMGAGACTLCRQCAYPEPCRHPDEAVTSMEAYGLWVSDVCERSGLAYNYGELTVAYTSCILLY